LNTPVIPPKGTLQPSKHSFETLFEATGGGITFDTDIDLDFDLAFKFIDLALGFLMARVYK